MTQAPGETRTLSDAEMESLRRSLRQPYADVDEFAMRYGVGRKMLATIDKLREALTECADGLSEYVEAYYEKTKGYLSEMRRYERDIEPVVKARMLLSGDSAAQSLDGEKADACQQGD